MTMSLRARIARDETGVSMAELLIYCLLLGGVLALVGTLFINQLRTEDTVSGVVDATTSAQLAARSIETGVRNSSDFTTPALTGSDQLLLARVVGEDGLWKCRAWYYSDSEGTIRTMSSSSAIPATAWSATNLKTWTLLTDGVMPAKGAATTANIWTKSATTLSLNFRVNAGNNPPATIITSTVSRLSQGSTVC